MASGYERTIGASDVAALPGASTDAFGAATGAGIQSIGEQMYGDHQRMQALKRDQAQDQQSVDVANRMADAQGAMAQSVADLRVANAANPDQHIPAVAQDFQDKTATILDGITSPQVRRSAQMQLASMRSGLAERETSWAAGQRVDNLVTGASTASDKLANLAAHSSDPSDWADLENQNNVMIDGFAGIPQDKRNKMKRDTGQQIYVSGLRASMTTNPQRVMTMLDHGALDDILDPNQISALRNETDVQIRRQDAEAKAQLALGKSQAEQQISIINSKLGDGIQVPDADLAQAQTLATQYKLDDKAYNLGAARQRQGVNIETKSWTPTQYQDEINRISALGDKASEADQVRLDQLRKISGPRIAEFTNNPGGYAANNGAPPPAIDQDSGDGFAARAQWRQGIQAGTGTWTPTLSKDEAAPWIEKVQHGTPADRLSTAQWISQWGSEAPNVLRQIDPNRDSAFSQAVALGSSSPANMRDALSGPEALKAIGGEERAFFVDPNNQLQHDAAGNKLTPGGLFGQDASRALMARGGPYAAAVMENARNIYATTAQRSGWTQFHPGEFQVSIRRALGGRQLGNGQWIGGLGTYNGGGFILPTTMTQQDFDRTLARASGADLFHAGNGEAVFSDGRTPHAAELKAMIPVSVGDGKYAWRVGSTFLQTKDHKPYVLDITRLSKP